MLKMGTIMPMPDIKDKKLKRSFLPRVISSKLPLLKISEMKRIFHAGENSSMARVLTKAVSECETAPSVDETKQCVGSVEDMIDFSISVLGHNVVVRTTENMEGSNKDVMIGKVSRINGGKVMKSVTCHQRWFPYLLYYCHSVLKVRVHEADILDPKTKAKINRGVAICHVDTSSWSTGHVAFMALGSGPGKIEFCASCGFALPLSRWLGAGVLIEVVYVLFLELPFVVCSCCSGVGLELHEGKEYWTREEYVRRLWIFAKNLVRAAEHQALDPIAVHGVTRLLRFVGGGASPASTTSNGSRARFSKPSG
ncbi:hypothetical protein RHSIM_Rhsim12G0119400 [Rhododendron simsii]|uniref:BURP domain-containing protein n=1 Tax=Rhododendron simsii TaxID=118357 RepID=A0A834GA11_RHOSS|nr:hypothetical protein RHSIM_Rhsim12G0119400 [Rhododendron simsii]